MAERFHIHHLRGNLCFPRGDLDGCAEASIATWFDGPMRTAADVNPDVRQRAWAMQRRAIDLENDDAQAQSPEPPTGERRSPDRGCTA